MLPFVDDDTMLLLFVDDNTILLVSTATALELAPAAAVGTKLADGDTPPTPPPLPRFAGSAPIMGFAGSSPISVGVNSRIDASSATVAHDVASGSSSLSSHTSVASDAAEPFGLGGRPLGPSAIFGASFASIVGSNPGGRVAAIVISDEGISFAFTVAPLPGGLSERGRAPPAASGLSCGSCRSFAGAVIPPSTNVASRALFDWGATRSSGELDDEPSPETICTCC
jgi:hypothetical protein